MDVPRCCVLCARFEPPGKDDAADFRGETVLHKMGLFIHSDQ